jgi:hypothetical protein
MSSPLEFSPSIFQLPIFGAAIQEFSAEGPDEYGDYTVSLKIAIENQTKSDWSLLEVCAVGLNDVGQQIGEVNSKEEGIAAGESSELELSIWRVAGTLLNGEHQKYHAAIKIFAATTKEKDLGSYLVPVINYEITPLPELKIENELLVIGGSLWRAEPDSEGDINIHANLSVQNISNARIPKVQFVASITKGSEELFDAGSSEELKLGDIQVIGSYGYSNEKDLKNASIACKIIYSSLAAECSLSIAGIDINTTEQETKKSKKSQSWPKPSSDDSDDEELNDIEDNEVDIPINLKEMNMSSKLVFKLVVEDSGKEVFTKPLSYETVANIASSYEDSDESNGFFALAAKHPASSVRENIAYKDKLSEEILSLLINDKSIPVLRNLVRTEAFKENASAGDIERLIKLDVEIAQNIAGDIDSYQQADASKLCSVILELDDPSILASLAGNSSTPKKVLKELLNHSDPYVASEAKRRLED